MLHWWKKWFAFIFYMLNTELWWSWTKFFFVIQSLVLDLLMLMIQGSELRMYRGRKVVKWSVGRWTMSQHKEMDLAKCSRPGKGNCETGFGKSESRNPSMKSCQLLLSDEGLLPNEKRKGPFGLPSCLTWRSIVLWEEQRIGRILKVIIF